MSAATAATGTRSPAVIRRDRIAATRRWSIAVTAYVLAVFHRTSLGVAGLQAADRFGINSSQLSAFVLLQLGVYAAMQIPTGLLVDRYGPRRLLITATLIMGSAQLLFAVATDYPTALLARGLLGCGDALTFVSVLRFAAGQFAPRRFPVVVAATALLGTLGNVVATVPLTLALHGAGWTPTFAVAGGLTVLTSGALYVLLPRPPTPTWPRPRQRAGQSLSEIGSRVARAWSMPGTRAGFWVHFTSSSTFVMFSVLWGLPFLVDAQGFSRTGASAVLLMTVAFSALVNVLVGVITSHRPVVRVPVAIATGVLTVLGWAFALSVFSGAIPRPVLIILVLVTSIGGPVSGIGFALARDYNGPSIVGTATGVVNVGGFLAATLACLGVGWTLDAAGPSPGTTGSPGVGPFRLAFAVAISVQVIGLVQMVRWWLRARRAVLADAATGREVPVAIVRHRWDLAATQAGPDDGIRDDAGA